MKKFILSVFLALSLLVTNVGSTVYVKAAPQETAYELAQYKLAITSRLSTLETNLNTTGNNQISMLFKMRSLSEYMMYYKHAYNQANTLGFSSTELAYYEDRIVQYIEIFNDQYGETTELFVGLKIDVNPLANSVQTESFTHRCSDIMRNDFLDYYDLLLNDIQVDLPSSEDEKALYLRNNGASLEALYKCIIIYQDVPNALTNITPLEEGATSRVAFTIDYPGVSPSTNEEVTTLVTTYEELLQYGKKIAQQTDNVSLEINPEDDPVVMFTNIEIDPNGDYIFPDGDVTLSQSYLAMLSASSTYTPFTSYVGSSEFINALIALAPDDKQASDLAKAYNVVKDYRKPLYKRTVTDDGNVTGVAELITLEDFLEDIQEGSAGALVTVQGDFHYNNEIQTWIYSQNELTYDYKIGDTIKEESAPQSDTSEAPADNSTTEGTPEASGYNIFDTVYPVADTNIPLNLDTTSTMVESLTNTIFVGDHRTGDLYDAFLSKGVTAEELNERNVHFVYNDDATYDGWFAGDCINEVNNLLTSDISYTIVISIGVNEPKSHVVYHTKINSLAKNDWKDYKVVFQSVGVVEDEYTIGEATYTNGDILNFNNEMRSNLSSEIEYVDITEDMINANGNINRSYTIDGLSYSHSTSLKICKNMLATLYPGSVPTEAPTKPTTEEQTTAESNPADASTETTESTEQDTELVADDLDSAIYAYDAITDEAYLTQPVLFYGTKYKRAIDNTTTALLQNIIKSTVNLDSIENKGSRYLYVNMFGDIVTDDNLVILPGVANPLIYNSQTAYNPYTVAFMNSYPNIANRGLYFQVTSDNAIGKYVLMAQNTEEDISSAQLSWALITSNSDVAGTNLYPASFMNDTFFVNGVEERTILSGQRCIFGAYSAWEKSNLSNYNVVMQSNTLVVNDILLFPYSVNEDINYEVAGAIARNTYDYIAYDRLQGVYSNTLTLNNNYLIHNYVISGAFGNKNPKGYSDAKALEYEQLPSMKFEQFTKQTISLSGKLINQLSGVDGVLGMDSSYEDPILGKFLRFAKENFIFLAIIILLILVISFIKYHRDLFEIIVLCALSMGAFALFVFVIPVYMPACFNFLVDYTSEETAFKVLGMNTDRASIDETYLLQVDEDGNYKYNSASLTLYKVGTKDLDSFYSASKTTMENVTCGNVDIINQEAGIFIEGDSIKVNTDILFDNLPITGSYTTANGSYCWQIKATKTVSNNVDYYVPYYYFVDNYINKLNLLAQIYELPRTTTVYATGESKDNYLVYAYTHSPVFVTPGEYGVVLQEDAKTTMVDYESYVEEAKELEMQLNAGFGNNADWLGVADVFINLSEEDKGTLWAQTMQQNGYYDENWNPDVEMINTLILYINNQTRNFVYSIDESIGNLSDETMIKLISLRATIAFTQEVSQFGTWLYPFSLDYAEITLGDILNATFASDYQKYVAMDMNIAEYIGYEHGWFVLILFDLLVILMFILTHIMNIMIPVLYLLFLGIIFVRFISLGDIKIPLRGYTKVSLSLFILYTIYNLTFYLLAKVNGVAWSIFVAIGISAIILYLVGSTLLAVFTNLMDFGDREFSARINAVSDKLKLTEVINKIKVSTVYLRHGGKRNQYNPSNNSRKSKYGFDSSVNSVYNDRRLN